MTTRKKSTTKRGTNARKKLDPNWAPPGHRALGLDIWKPDKPGERRQGVYLGSFEILSPQKRTKKKTFLSHHFADVETGELFALSGAALDVQLSKIKTDTPVWIVYRGMKDLPNNRTMKDFALYVEE